MSSDTGSATAARSRDYFVRDLFLGLPKPLVQVQTWLVLALEVLFLPVALLPRLRPFMFFGIVAMHLGILAVVSFADLTIGMLMIHVFTFDARWLRAWQSATPARI